MTALRRQKRAYFAAFLFVALALGPGLAHLFALPNKVGLPVEAYFAAQQIYRGWALLGIVVVGALASTATLAVVLHGLRSPAIWAAVAFLCIVAAQVLFWTLTFPANQATANWTEMVPDWPTLRRQWEFSHAVAAGFDLAAMLALTVSVLRWAGLLAKGDRP